MGNTNEKSRQKKNINRSIDDWTDLYCDGRSDRILC